MAPINPQETARDYLASDDPAPTVKSDRLLGLRNATVGADSFYILSDEVSRVLLSCSGTLIEVVKANPELAHRLDAVCEQLIDAVKLNTSAAQRYRQRLHGLHLAITLGASKPTSKRGQALEERNKRKKMAAQDRESAYWELVRVELSSMLERNPHKDPSEREIINRVAGRVGATFEAVKGVLHRRERRIRRTGRTQTPTV